MELSWRLGGDIGDFLFGDGKTQKNGEFDGLEWHFMGVDWNSMGVFFVFFLDFDGSVGLYKYRWGFGGKL